MTKYVSLCNCKLSEGDNGIEAVPGVTRGIGMYQIKDVVGKHCMMFDQKRKAMLLYNEQY